MAERALHGKSTIEEIRARFDADVERFSSLETGQKATIDAPLAMELITGAALACSPRPRRVLDVGCGAGNNTLKLVSKLQAGALPECHLADLSRPMLDRAEQRLREAGVHSIRAFRGDIREAALEEGAYDIVLAAAVLHHLRDDADWESTLAKLFRATAPGGCIWITDLVAHEIPSVHDMMWEAYGGYLVSIGGAEYRDHVVDYIEKEDSPRPVTWQLDLLRRVGFVEVDILHKNSCFAAFGGRRPS